MDWYQVNTDRWRYRRRSHHLNGNTIIGTAYSTTTHYRTGAHHLSREAQNYSAIHFGGLPWQPVWRMYHLHPSPYPSAATCRPLQTSFVTPIPMDSCSGRHWSPLLVWYTAILVAVDHFSKGYKLISLKKTPHSHGDCHRLVRTCILLLWHSGVYSLWSRSWIHLPCMGSIPSQVGHQCQPHLQLPPLVEWSGRG